MNSIPNNLYVSSMAIKGSLYVFFLMSLYSSLAQIKLNPELGLAFTNNRMVGGNQDFIRASQLDLSPYFGLELEKDFKNYSLSLAIHTTNVNLSFKYDSPFYGEILGAKLIGTSYGLFGFRIRFNELFVLGKNLDADSFDDVTIDRFNQNRRTLVLYPKVGLFLNRLSNTYWQSYSSDTTQPAQSGSPNGITLSSRDGWDVGPEGSKKIEENKLGVSLQLGLDFQFRKRNRDGIRFSLFYNFGLVTLLNTTNTFDLEGEEKTVRLKTNGSFLAFTISYPITLLKKKGERRWNKD